MPKGDGTGPANRQPLSRKCGGCQQARSGRRPSAARSSRNGCSGNTSRRLRPENQA